MKNIRTFFKIAGLCLGVLLIAACPSAFNSPISFPAPGGEDIPAGKGLVRLNIANSARTIMPITFGDFVYSAEFVTADEEIPEAERIVTIPDIYAADADAIQLYADVVWTGTLEVSVGNVVVANAILKYLGSTDIVLVDQADITLDKIYITPAPASDFLVDDGIIEYNITFPEGLKSAAFYVDYDDGTMDFFDIADAGDLAALSLSGWWMLPPGSYLVRAVLVAEVEGTDVSAGRVEVVHIYKEQETLVDWRFTTDMFFDVRPVIVSVDIIADDNAIDGVTLFTDGGNYEGIGPIGNTWTFADVLLRFEVTTLENVYLIIETANHTIQTTTVPSIVIGNDDIVTLDPITLYTLTVTAEGEGGYVKWLWPDYALVDVPVAPGETALFYLPEGCELGVTLEFDQNYFEFALDFTGIDAQNVDVNYLGFDFDMPANPVTVIVTFKHISYTVTASDSIIASEGAIYLSTVNDEPEYGAGPLEITATDVEIGTTVFIKAVPAAGYNIGTVSASSSDNPSITLNDTLADEGIWSFVMDVYDVTVTATFTEIAYTVTVSAEIEDGNVLIGTGAAAIDQTSLDDITVGTTIFISATPTAPFNGVASITVTFTGEGAPAPLTMNALTPVTPGAVWSFTMPAFDAAISATFVFIPSGGFKVYSNGVFYGDFSIGNNTVAPDHWTNTYQYVDPDYDVDVAQNGTNTKAMQLFRGEDGAGNIAFSITSAAPIDLSGTGGLIFRIWFDGINGNPIRWIGFGNGANGVVWQGNANVHNFNPTHEARVDGSINGDWPGGSAGWYTVFIPVPKVKTSGMNVTTLFSIRLELSTDIGTGTEENPQFPASERQYLIDDIEFIPSTDIVNLTRISIPGSNPPVDIGTTLTADQLFNGQTTRFMYSADLTEYANFGETVYTWIAAENHINDGGQMQTFANWGLANDYAITSSNTDVASVTAATTINALQAGTSNITLRVGTVSSVNTMILTVLSQDVAVIDDFDYATNDSWVDQNEFNRGFWGQNLSGPPDDSWPGHSNINPGAAHDSARGIHLTTAFFEGESLQFGRKFGQAGFYGSDGSVNISDYTELTFMFRRYPNVTDNITFSFAFTNEGTFNTNGTATGAGTLYEVDFTAQALAIPIVTWGKITIPISDFVTAELDPTAVTGYAIVITKSAANVGGAGDNRVHFDTIMLE
ncbi:MAG: hypothetical protein FWD36_04305 [Treponema sp.]|nr:hypothetical protein [Treponema sp.]